VRNTPKLANLVPAWCNGCEEDVGPKLKLQGQVASQRETNGGEIGHAPGQQPAQADKKGPYPFDGQLKPQYARYYAVFMLGEIVVGRP
jgi:hypothetical protein